MARFNTGNTVDSKDPRDLSDNAQNIDQWVNSEAASFPDRLGVQRRTLKGMDGEFQSFLDGSAYDSLGDYAAGIEVSARNQLIRAEGDYWRASAGTELPYTTTGAGMPEAGAFVSVGDAVLRQDLAGTDGLDFIGGTGTAAARNIGTGPEDVPDNSALDSRGFAQSVASVEALRAMAIPDSLERIWLDGYYGQGTPGGGPLYIDRDNTTTADNGGTVFVTADGVRVKRASSKNVGPYEFGAVGDGETDDTAALELYRDYLPEGGAWVDSPGVFVCSDFTINKKIIFLGSGGEFKRLPGQSDSEFVIEIAGDKSVFYNIKADGSGDVEPTTSPSGRRLGILITGRDVTLYDPETYNNNSENYGGFEIRQSCTIYRGLAVDSVSGRGAGTFRGYQTNSGEPVDLDGNPSSVVNLIDCKCETNEPSRRIRWWANGGNFQRISVVRPEIEFNEGEVGDLFLAETGPGGTKLKKWELLGASITISADITTNFMKSVNVDEVLIEGCYLESRGTGGVFYRIQDQYSTDSPESYKNRRVVIKNTTFVTDAGSTVINYDPQNYDDHPVTLVVSDVTFNVLSDTPTLIRSFASETYIDKLNVIGPGLITSEIVRLAASLSDAPDQRHLLSDIYCEAPSNIAAVVDDITGDVLSDGDVGQVSLISPPEGINFTGSSGRSIAVKINKSSEHVRHFYDFRPFTDEGGGLFSIDFGNGWRTGDHVLTRNPTDGDPLAHVCVVSGDSATARFVVAY